MEMTTFREFLLKLRMSKGMTLKEFSKLCKTSVPVITNLEQRGILPSFRVRANIIRNLGYDVNEVPIVDLFGAKREGLS